MVVGKAYSNAQTSSIAHGLRSCLSVRTQPLTATGAHSLTSTVTTPYHHTTIPLRSVPPIRIWFPDAETTARNTFFSQHLKTKLCAQPGPLFPLTALDECSPPTYLGLAGLTGLSVKRPVLRVACLARNSKNHRLCKGPVKVLHVVLYKRRFRSAKTSYKFEKIINNEFKKKQRLGKFQNQSDLKTLID